MPVQSASSPSRSSQEEQTSEVKPAEALKLLFERCMALLDPSQQAFCQVNLKSKLQQSCCYFLKVAATKGFKIVCGKKTNVQGVPVSVPVPSMGPPLHDSPFVLNRELSDD